MGNFTVSSAEASDVRLVGGKAAALGRLLRAGFDVPPFFVIPSTAFTDDGLVDSARSDVAGKLAALGAGPFAVRSSCTEEDSATDSHAGQFLTILNVADGDVAAAAHRVWRSGLTDGLRAYRHSRGLDPDGGMPAVIVQRMLNPNVAGVAFSADPVSGRRDRVLVSAIAGLADRLVGGEEDGDDYVVDRSTAVAEPRPPGVLPPAAVAAVAKLAVRVEAEQGVPQDVEWAMEGERLYLLQARPITTTLAPAPSPDETLTVFDNSNIVESYPGVVSPLTFSFAQYAYAQIYQSFAALLGVAPQVVGSKRAVFENLLGRYDGRVYYNLANWYRALALIPGFGSNRQYMETMMGVSEPLPADAIPDLAAEPVGKTLGPGDRLRMFRVAFGVVAAGVKLKPSMRAFYGRLERALEKRPSEIDAMPLSALADEYRRIEAELLDRWDAPLVNDLLCMIAFGASLGLARKWAGDAGRELHNRTMIGQGDIISAEPAQRIRRMGALLAGDETTIAALRTGDRARIAARADLAAALDQYLAKFSDRCPAELKLESIPLDENPAPLWAAVAAAAETRPPTDGAKPSPSTAVLAGRPLRRWVLGVALRYAKSLVRNRENLRFERTRLFGQARRLLRAMGREFVARGMLDAPRDVFFLTVAEVLGAIEGSAVSGDLKGLAKIRAGEMASASSRPDPAERIMFRGAVGAQGAGQAHRVAEKAPSADDDLRKGTGCSAGRIRARARVVLAPEGERLERGEVLVARYTDPGWIALFANASAIVVERGSLLSHSAIVARELGIPCIVGLKGATGWINTGDELDVDGAVGTVRKMRA